MYLKDNILHIDITKGTDFTLHLGSPDLDLTQYDTIRADFKPTKAIDAPALIRADLDEGITVTPDTLVLRIPYSTTEKIRYERLYMDIKARIGDASPVLLM